MPNRANRIGISDKLESLWRKISLTNSGTNAYRFGPYTTCLISLQHIEIKLIKGKDLEKKQRCNGERYRGQARPGDKGQSKNVSKI
jgi:hypothetical protein